MIKHINIHVYGTVQGVGFRRAATNQARYLGIKGYVKNEIDGSVYIEAEGDATAVSQFVIWCRKGPTFSQVEKVETVEGKVMNYYSFDSKY